jgi:hypothetical protein
VRPVSDEGSPYPTEEGEMMDQDSREYWRKILGIEIGMTKQEAMQKFREWQEANRTCSRCEGENLVDFCPVRLICEEAKREEGMEYESARGQVDSGTGSLEDPGDKEGGFGEYEERAGFDLCESL